MGELRESKKRETRQRLSDLATSMFFARGFDAVTVDEIAVAANVSKVTVFNYFAKKEDLFLDRLDEAKDFVTQALRERRKGESAVDALRKLVVDRLVEEKSPYARIDEQTAGWWRVVAGSATLQARVREIADEATEGLATMIAGSPKPDVESRLVAGMVVLTWRTAHAEALRLFEAGASSKKANATFLAIIDRGFTAAKALMK